MQSRTVKLSTVVSRPSPERLFIAGLNKAIEFHRTSTDNSHNAKVPVMIALTEVRDAFADAHGLPKR